MNKKELLELYAGKCIEDILFFAQEFVPHLLTAKSPAFHEEIYKLVWNKPRLVIAAPRGFAKSYIVSVIYPLWLGCVGASMKDICIISASETLALKWLREIKREFENNPKIKAVFGDMKTSKWAESNFITKSGVTYLARGAGGQIKGFRPDCLILDDIENPEEVESEEQRKKLKSWVFKDCFPALKPNGQFLMIGTIDHPLSVLSDIFIMDNGWTKRKYQAYRQGIQEKGYELWPELWPHEALQRRKKEIGTFAFASQYMNDPVSDESAPIKPNQIRCWKELPSQLSMVITVDPAYSEDASADYKVAALIGIDQQLNRYLISYVRTHAPVGEFFDSILNMWLQNRGTVTAIGIPNSGTEKQFFGSFVKHANDQRKQYPPISELKNSFITSTGSSVRAKKSRIIAALQPLFESGKYYIHGTHIEALDELLSVGHSRWDDLSDCMAYAEQLLTPFFVDAKEPMNDGDRNLEYAHSSSNRPNNYGYDS